MTLRAARRLPWVALCAALAGAAPLHAADDEHAWELRRDRDDIQVYTRKVEGSRFKAVRAVMEINGSLNQLVGLVQDVAACPEWAALCKEARLIEQQSETDMYVHTLNDLPWPVSDRDAVAHVQWSQDAGTLAVTMVATATPDKLPTRRGVVRIGYAETSWVFTPKGDGRVEVVSLAHVDPSGGVPAWLTNRLLVDSPWDTMRDMRTLIDDGRYVDARFSFVSEPVSQ